MLGMQNSDGTTGLERRFMNQKLGDNTGFSQGAYNSNNFSGFGDRGVRRSNIPSINTRAQEQPANHSQSEQTPGASFGLNFTPFLPTDLLLGSPFQPGSPNAFGSSQFSNFRPFQPSNNALHQQTQQYQQSQQQHMGSPTQQHASQMSPQLYSNMMSPNDYGASQMLGPQSPGGYGAMTATAYGSPPMMQIGNPFMSGTSRTVYLGNIPPDTSAEEILSHVRSGQIESVRLLPDKNCAFISFIDGSSATHFHSDAILKKLKVKGHDIKIGWGKQSQVPTSVALAVQQQGASRNVYLGNLPEDISEQEIRENVAKFGPIDTVKLVREKNIGFVHFLSVSNAIKAVAGLPQEPKWQPPRRVYYGKDRCAYVSKTEQQNAAQYLGIAPGYGHVLNGADRDLISNTLAQQSVAAAAVATTAGGVNNLGNRTVYLGNIHPETTIEEICNVVRGGLLHHIRYIPDKHICFVTFIDPTSAASFYALSNLQGLMIHNRRLKIGWGKHSGALPPAIALAVSGGASRNVYIGNLDESWTEDRLRQDFSEYGEIELVNALREKSCAFVNFTNIANAIKAIEAIRGREEYKRFKINFGKDRCGNPPRQQMPSAQHQNQQHRYQNDMSGLGSPPQMNGYSNGMSQTGSSPSRSELPAQQPSNHAHQQQIRQPQPDPTPSSILNAGSNNPLTMYLSQVSQQQQEQDLRNDNNGFTSLQQQQNQALATQQAALYGDKPNGHPGLDHGLNPQHQARQNSISSSFAGNSNSNNGSTTVGGLLAPTDNGYGARGSAHSRAVSLPAFSQELFGGQAQQQQASRAFGGHAPQGSFGGFGSAFGTGFGTSGFGGLGLSTTERTGLNGWAEKELGAKEIIE